MNSVRHYILTSCYPHRNISDDQTLSKVNAHFTTLYIFSHKAVFETNLQTKNTSQTQTSNTNFKHNCPGVIVYSVQKDTHQGKAHKNQLPVTKLALLLRNKKIKTHAYCFCRNDEETLWHYFGNVQFSSLFVVMLEHVLPFRDIQVELNIP